MFMGVHCFNSLSTSRPHEHRVPTRPHRAPHEPRAPHIQCFKSGHNDRSAPSNHAYLPSGSLSSPFRPTRRPLTRPRGPAPPMAHPTSPPRPRNPERLQGCAAQPPRRGRHCTPQPASHLVESTQLILPIMSLSEGGARLRGSPRRGPPVPARPGRHTTNHRPASRACWVGIHARACT